MENYNIKFEEAKELKVYSFWSIDIGDIKEAITNKNSDKKVWDVVAMLEIGYVDIELTLRDWDIENNIAIYDYYICCNTGEDNSLNGWESYDIYDYGFSILKMKTNEELEKDMFNQLMKGIKEYNLTWSVPNKDFEF